MAFNDDYNGYGYGPQAGMQMPWQMPSYQGATAPGAQNGNSSGGSQNSIAGMLPLIMGAVNSFGGKQGASVKQLGNINNAMVNPSNPLYQQLYGQNRQAMMQDFGNASSALEGRNRSLSAMGRTPLFSPERNGETTFRNMTQGYAAAGQQAAGQTENQLSNAAATISRGTLPAQQYDLSRNQGGYQDIASFLGKLGI